MKLRWLSLLAATIWITQPASAHHLDDYDSRIRKEANLPAAWFACRTSEDCALVSVPCQSGLAVNADHSAQAQEALNQKYFFCLGSSLEDTVASCHARQCATEPKEK
jgi:hypothetical protein